MGGTSVSETRVFTIILTKTLRHYNQYLWILFLQKVSYCLRSSPLLLSLNSSWVIIRRILDYLGCQLDSKLSGETRASKVLKKQMLN